MPSVSGNLKSDKLTIQGHGTLAADVVMSVESDTFLMKMGGDVLMAVSPEGAADINDGGSGASTLTLNRNTVIAGDLNVTGVSTAVTQAAGNNTTRVATTAFVRGEVAALVGGASGAYDTLQEIQNMLMTDASGIASLVSSVAAKAPLASPSLTGVPTAPTAAAGVNTTQLATTSFVHTEIANLVDGATGAYDTLKEIQDLLVADASGTTAILASIGAKAPLASPAFTGTVNMASNANVGGALDVSGNLAMRGSMTLGTNSVLSSDGSTNVNITGKIIPNFIGAPVMDPNIDWEGVWTYTAAASGANGSNAFLFVVVKQANNTYTIYSTVNPNDLGASAGQQITTTNIVKPTPGLYKIASNVYTGSQSLPEANGCYTTITYDSFGKITENSIRIVFRDTTVPTPITFRKKVGTIDGLKRNSPTSNFAYILDWIPLSDTSNNVCYGSHPADYQIYMAQRVVHPSIFGVTDSSIPSPIWFSDYQQQYYQTQLQVLTGFQTSSDLKGLYENLKTQLCVYIRSLNSYNTSTISLQSTEVHKKYKSVFNILKMHEYLKTNKLTYNFPVNNVSKFICGYDHLIKVNYDFFEPYDVHLNTHGRFTLNKPVGLVPAGFLWENHNLFRSIHEANWINMQNVDRFNNYLTLQMPFMVDASNYSVDAAATVPMSFVVRQGGVDTSFNINLPTGPYYPHVLCEKINALIKKASGTANIDQNVRIDYLYTNTYSSATNTTTMTGKESSYYYLTVDTSGSTVSVSSTNNDLMYNVLGFVDSSNVSTLRMRYTAPFSVTGGGVTVRPVAPSGSTGRLPAYTLYGAQPSRYFDAISPSSFPDTSGLVLNSSFGSVLTSEDPSDMVNTIQYLGFWANVENHVYGYFSVLNSDAKSTYCPRNWDDYIYKIDNLQAPFTSPSSTGGVASIQYATNSFPYGVLGKEVNLFVNGPVADSRANGTLNAPSLYPDAGTTTATTAPFPYMHMPLSSFNKYLAYTYDKSPTFQNYFKNNGGELNCIMYQFTSTSTVLTNLAGTGWVNRYGRDSLVLGNTSPLTGLFSIGSRYLPVPTDVSKNVILQNVLTTAYNSPLQTANSLTYCPNQNAVLIGVLDQVIVNNLIPDSSGKKVGYFRMSSEGGSYSYGNYQAYSDYRPVIAKYFNDKNVDFIVIDVRGNPGGHAISEEVMPFCDPDLPSNDSNLLVAPNYFMTTKNEFATRMYEIFGDINKNPSQWDSTCVASLAGVTYDSSSYPVCYDASGIFISGPNPLGGFDFTTFKTTNNVNNIARHRKIFPGEKVSDYYCNAKTLGHPLKIGLICDNRSNSWGQDWRYSALKQGGDSGILDSSGTVSYNILGSEYKLYASSQYTQNIKQVPGVINSTLLNNTFYQQNNPAHFIVLDNSGNAINEPNLAIQKMDALADMTCYHLHLQYGIIDASGNSIDASGSPVNEFGCSINDPATWRDFQLERGIQIASKPPKDPRSNPTAGKLVFGNTYLGDLPANVFV